MLKVGDCAPNFKLMDDSGKSVALKDFKGKKVVLYFYPKDDTPGCTREACGFRDQMKQFKSRGTVIVGVSKDDVPSHSKFKKKYGLSFPLLSDPEKKTIQTYGIWKEKNMVGKKTMGVERTTFLIDERGKIAKIYPKVKVDGHITHVLESLK